jgi:hypothetical protein
VIAGDDNRAAFAFLGTTAIGDDQTNLDFPANAQWYMYISTTYDGGQTWTTINATPGDPVQHGCIDLQGIAVGTSRTDVCSRRNLLDFNDITVDAQGRVLVAYADGCTSDACIHDPASTEATAVNYVLRQWGDSSTFLVAPPPVNAPEAPLVLLIPLVGLAAVLFLRSRGRRRT